jgi:hypothetical protein
MLVANALRWDGVLTGGVLSYIWLLHLNINMAVKQVLKQNKGP